MQLKGQQLKALHEALLNAFPKHGELERLVHFRLDIALNQIAGGQNHSDTVFQLIRWCEARGRLSELIRAAREENPQNQKLSAFGNEMAPTPDRFALLKTLNALLGPQFEQVLFFAQPPAGVLSPPAAPQATRVVELLQWADSPTGRGLAAIEEAIRHVNQSPPEVKVTALRLDGSQKRKLRDALTDAFSRRELRMLLAEALDRNWEKLTDESSFDTQVFDVIDKADRQGWVTDLIIAARTEYPDNTSLRAFAQQLSLAPSVPPELHLESMLRRETGFLNLDQWYTRLGGIMNQVCSIEVTEEGGTRFGTGFLIGPDLVMTNYHVVSSVVEAPGADSDRIVFRFDYRRTIGRDKSGTVFRLAPANWKVDCSTNAAEGTTPRPDQLDYAILRLNGSPGSESATVLDHGGTKRGWLSLNPSPAALTTGKPLFVVQHPGGRPLSLALETNSVQELLYGGLRVRYATNTDVGASGSPCFDINWNLVALHHAGDIAYPPRYNQGIPIQAIYKLLKDRGIDQILPQHS